MPVDSFREETDTAAGDVAASFIREHVSAQSEGQLDDFFAEVGGSEQLKCRCAKCYGNGTDWPLFLQLEEERLSQSLVELKRTLEEFLKTVAAFKNEHSPQIERNIKEVLEGTSEMIFATAAADVDTALDVQATISQGQKTKRYKIMRKVHKLLQGAALPLDACEGLAKLLPFPGMTYSSLLFGVLRVIINASSACENIRDSVPKALQDVSEEVNFLKFYVQRSDNPGVRQCFVEMSTQLFNFYSNVLNWYKNNFWAASKQALGINVYAELFAPLAEVNRTSIKIYHRLDQDNAHTLIHGICALRKDMKTGFNDVDAVKRELADLRRGMERKQSYMAQQAKFMVGGRLPPTPLLLQLADEETARVFPVSFWLLFDSAKGSFQSGAYSEALIEQYPQLQVFHDAKPKIHNLESVEENQETAVEQELVQEVQSGGATVLYTREALRARCAALDSHTVSDPYTYLNSVRNGDDHVERAALYAVQRWLGSTTTSVLWIRQRASASSLDYPAATTYISSTVVNLILSLKIPVLTFFCPWPWSGYEGEDLVERTRNCQMDILFSLICQTVHQLPPEFETKADFSEKRFAELLEPDGRERGVKLLEDLMDLWPPLIYIVLDGFDHLTESSDRGCINGILEILARAIQKATSKDSAGERTVKLLLTTASDSDLLRRFFDVIDPATKETLEVRAGGLKLASHIRFSDVQSELHQLLQRAEQA